MKTKTTTLILLVLGVCLFHENAFADRERVIRVVDFKSKSGVKSEVFRRSPAGNEISLGDTDAQGEKRIPAPGTSGERLRAVPKSPRYYDSSTDCPLQAGQTIVEVIAFDSLGGSGQKALLAKARAAEAADRPAEAALALKQLIQTTGTEPALATLLQKRIFELSGEIFDVKIPAQPQANETRWTATPRLEKRVREFQKESGLHMSGTLDKPTLAKAAERERNSTREMTTTTGRRQ